MDSVFRALAHPDRRRILDILRNRPGLPVGAVAEDFPVSRIAVQRQLRILEAAGLLTSEKRGRTRRLYLNPVPIQMIHDRWTTEYSALWAGRMTQVKYRVESEEPDDG